MNGHNGVQGVDLESGTVPVGTGPGHCDWPHIFYRGVGSYRKHGGRLKS